MRMTVGQLRRIIRETVEEEMMRQDLNEGLWDSIKGIFGGGAKFGSMEIAKLMGPCPTDFSHSWVKYFKPIFDVFEEDSSGKNYAWTMLTFAAGKFAVEVSKGEIWANEEESLKKLTQHLKNGKKDLARRELIDFVGANGEGITNFLMREPGFSTRYYAAKDEWEERKSQKYIKPKPWDSYRASR